MIAFVLRETGRDPAWLIGAPVPQLGSNAGAGEGWLVVEGDESDRTVFGLPAEIAVVTNVELDHHTEFASLAELEAEFERWLAAVPHVVRDAPPFDGELALPGEHNRRNAGAALAALELAGVPRDEAAPALARFTGTGRRFEVSEAGGVTIVDDYAHHPTEIAATIAAARERFPGRRLRVLFQPHLYSRTRHLAAELADALAAADDVAVTDVYPAREEPVAGRDRQARRRRALRPRACSPAGRRRSRSGAATSRGGRSRATCCSCSAPATSTAPVARLLGWLTLEGGRRRSRATRRSAPAGRRGASRGPRRSTSSRRCSRWARERGRGGRGDRARLEPARARRRSRRARAAARRRARRGARRGTRCSSPAAARRTRSASTGRATPGSAASSSPRAIPGTAGGGVRMNAGAYGSDWRDVLVDARRRRRRRRAHAHGRRARALLPPLGPASRARSSPQVRVPARAAAGRRRSRRRSPSCSRSGRRRSRRPSARSAACSRTRATSSGAGG